MKIGVVVFLACAGLSLLLPGAADAQTGGAGWFKVDDGIVQRPKPGGGLENDVTKNEKPGSTAEVIEANKEVKCTSSRGDNAPSTSADIRAKFFYSYEWRPGTNNEAVQPWVIYNLAVGAIGKAEPLDNLPPGTPQEQRPGMASASGTNPWTTVSVNNQTTYEAANKTLPSTPRVRAQIAGTVFPILLEVSAMSSASSIYTDPVITPGDGDDPPPSGGTGQRRYHNKACSSEGRAYARLSGNVQGFYQMPPNND